MDADLQNIAFLAIDRRLRANEGWSAIYYGLLQTREVEPLPDPRRLPLQERTVLAQYNREGLEPLVEAYLPRLKVDQRHAYDAIMKTQGTLRAGGEVGLGRLPRESRGRESSSMVPVERGRRSCTRIFPPPSATS